MTEQEQEINYQDKIFKQPIRKLQQRALFWVFVVSLWAAWAGANFALDITKHHGGWQVGLDVFLWAAWTALLWVQVQTIALKYGRELSTNILEDLRESLFDVPEEDRALRRTAKTKRNKT